MTVELKVGSVTLYGQLASIFRDLIYTGQWKSGQDIPTLEELVKEFDVARATVRSAIGILTEEGLLSTQRGRRTSVRYAAQPPELRPFFSSVELLKSSQHSIEVLEERDVSTAVSTLLEEGFQAGRFRFIRKIDHEAGAPFTLSASYVASDIWARFPPHGERHRKLFHLIASVAPDEVARATERITIGMPSIEEAKLLRIETAMPLARLTRLVLDDAGNIILAGEYLLPGKLVRIERDIKSAFTK